MRLCRSRESRHADAGCARTLRAAGREHDVVDEAPLAGEQRPSSRRGMRDPINPPMFSIAPRSQARAFAVGRSTVSLTPISPWRPCRSHPSASRKPRRATHRAWRADRIDVHVELSGLGEKFGIPMVRSKAAISAALRSAGMPGGAANGRAMACPISNNLRICAAPAPSRVRSQTARPAAPAVS